MDHNPKKCKGIGKAHGVSGCGTKTLYRKYGLCTTCLSEFYREDERGKIIVQKSIIKAVSPRLKAQKDLEIASQERKQKNRLESLKVNVRTVCHNYIKLRDKNKPCISCGQPWHKDFHAGHFYKAELYSSLKYDEQNIHGQCQGCNLRKEGNLSPYAVSLPNRIGAVLFKELNDKAALEKQTNFKWDRQTLAEIRKYYQLKIKQL